MRSIWLLYMRLGTSRAVNGNPKNTDNRSNNSSTFMFKVVPKVLS